jgi:protein-S-isoprenylcysteine O-methyltransferase Ste14
MLKFLDDLVVHPVTVLSACFLLASPLVGSPYISFGMLPVFCFLLGSYVAKWEFWCSYEEGLKKSKAKKEAKREAYWKSFGSGFLGPASAIGILYSLIQLTGYDQLDILGEKFVACICFLLIFMGHQLSIALEKRWVRSKRLISFCIFLILVILAGWASTGLGAGFELIVS